MEIFIVVFAVFALSSLLLAVGYLAKRKPLQGSCGGISQITGERCAVCGKENPNYKKA